MDHIHELHTDFVEDKDEIRLEEAARGVVPDDDGALLDRLAGSRLIQVSIAGVSLFEIEYTQIGCEAIESLCL